MEEYKNILKKHSTKRSHMHVFQTWSSTRICFSHEEKCRPTNMHFLQKKKAPPRVYSVSAICGTFVETNKPFGAQQSGNQRLCCNNLPKSQLFTLRTVSPKLPQACAAKRDAQVWRCFSRIWGVTEATTPASAKFIASLPLSKGGLGLRSAVRSRSRPQMRARRLP